MGSKCTIHDYVIIGPSNPYQDIFNSESEKEVHIGDECVISPYSIIYEGATLGNKVIIGERSFIGSNTSIGEGTKILYYGQVHDNVAIGTNNVIAGFIADNTTIGNECSIFGALVHRYDSPNPRRWDYIDEEGPLIGSGVIVGWGAVVVGPIQIGDWARIRPNAVVRQDISAGCTYG